MTKVECPSCGEQTFAFERDCHRCGINRWEHTGTAENEQDA